MTRAYELISEHYAMQCAKRSGVPLINHIDEGILILDWLGEPQRVKDAYCLHPMLQTDKDLNANWKEVCIEMLDQEDGTEIVMLAMEYRSVANDFLSDKVNGAVFTDIRLSPISAVNSMLIADKIQNRKDFEQYHLGTHDRSDELDKYFKIWLQRLGVSKEMYQNYVEVLNGRKQTTSK